MGSLDFFFHLLGFCAPAVAVAILVALAARVLSPRRAKYGPWWVQAAINSIAGVLVLGVGLWYFGVDGKMATYAVLVAVVASCQWVGSRGWRG